MKNLIGLFFILFIIGLTNTVEKPWSAKTPAEIEEIIDSVSLNAPTVI